MYNTIPRQQYSKYDLVIQVLQWRKASLSSCVGASFIEWNVRHQISKYIKDEVQKLHIRTVKTGNSAYMEKIIQSMMRHSAQIIERIP